jgi:hypothetical protein
MLAMLLLVLPPLLLLLLLVVVVLVLLGLLIPAGLLWLGCRRSLTSTLCSSNG